MALEGVVRPADNSIYVDKGQTMLREAAKDGTKLVAGKDGEALSAGSGREAPDGVARV